MTPYFKDFASFLAMGGHGFYVWLCWAIVVGSVVLGIVLIRAERARTLKHLANNHARSRGRGRALHEPLDDNNTTTH